MREEKSTLKIACFGVKGGVGKTTFAILLAMKLLKEGKRVLLCDLDVECPNCYVLLNRELRNGKPIFKEFPELDEELCRKCGRCFEVCRENAIFWVKGKTPIFLLDFCSGCMACHLACPNQAIKIKKRKIGDCFIDEINETFVLMTGKSEVGIKESSLVVDEVKREALKYASEKKFDVLIFDLPPGMHCNVVKALIGCDFAYAVTEPTPLGAHDLELAIRLARKLNVKVAIVLNKAGIGKRELIEEIARRYNVEIKFELPYSQDVARAYCSRDIARALDSLRQLR